LQNYPKEVHSRETSLLVFPNLLMTAAIAKKQVREAKGEPVGGNEVQAAAFEAFMDMHSLNDLIEAPDAGESFIYAACLLYPDLVKMLIQKVAK